MESNLHIETLVSGPDCTVVLGVTAKNVGVSVSSLSYLDPVGV